MIFNHFIMNFNVRCISTTSPLSFEPRLDKRMNPEGNVQPLPVYSHCGQVLRSRRDQLSRQSRPAPTTKNLVLCAGASSDCGKLHSRCPPAEQGCGMILKYGSSYQCHVPQSGCGVPPKFVSRHDPVRLGAVAYAFANLLLLGDKQNGRVTQIIELLSVNNFSTMFRKIILRVLAVVEKPAIESKCCVAAFQYDFSVGIRDGLLKPIEDHFCPNLGCEIGNCFGTKLTKPFRVSSLNVPKLAIYLAQLQAKGSPLTLVRHPDVPLQRRAVFCS